ncbi:hypothetical protein Tco_0474885 [Tanacetum coccineum]
MVAWFLGLEDVLSWLLVVGNRDAITVLRNSIALFRLANGSSPGKMMELELLEVDTVGNDKVLHKIMNVVERDNSVEQLVITVVDIE